MNVLLNVVIVVLWVGGAIAILGVALQAMGFSVFGGAMSVIGQGAMEISAVFFGICFVVFVIAKIFE